MKIKLPYRALFGLLAAVFFTIWLYLPTLRLPLIYDSLLHIRIASGLNLNNVWLPTEAFGFYRPMTFVPLLLVERLWGGYPAGLLHGLNVVQHALNVLLIALLGKRVWGKWRVGVTAAFLFAAFPFSYQAVAVYGHNVHPTIANLILLGLHGYLSALESERRWKRPLLWLFTLLCYLLAVLTHESAILFGPFAGLVQWTRPGRAPQLSLRELDPRRSPWLIFVLLGVVYFVVYQYLPISRAPQAEEASTAALQLRALYLLQAAVYPLAWLGKRVGVDSAVAIIGVSALLYSSLVIWRARRAPNRYPLLFAIGWWGLAFLLIGVPLSADYLLRGPRLLYLGSVGVCFAWAALFTEQEGCKSALQRIGPSPPHPFTSFLSYSLTPFLFIALLFASTLFVRQKLAAYTQLTQPVSVLREAVAQPEAGEGVLLLNLPQWLDAPQTAFPVGVEFVSMLGGYLFVEELVQFNLDAPIAAQAAVLNEQFQETPYAVGLHAQTPIERVTWQSDGVQHVVLTRYEADGPHAQTTGYIGAPSGKNALATFGPYTLWNATLMPCPDAITLFTIWTHDPDVVLPTQTLFAQGLDASGQLVAQADGPPLGIRPDLLQTERPYADIRHLANPNQQIQTVWLGVYDFTTGERVPGVDEEKRPLPHSAFTLTAFAPCSQPSP